MVSIKDEIITAFQQDNLLQVVIEKSRSERDNLDNLYANLIGLHNNGEIDIISSFKALRNESNARGDFFLARDVLENILSKLDAPILLVMECVLHLFNEAGQDMAAGMILNSFMDYCAVDASRPKEALIHVEKSTNQYADLLPPVIVAGARIDTEYYLDEAIRLSKHDDIEMRRRAIFSIGRIEYPREKDFLDEVLFRLELSAEEETDDRLLGNIINSAFRLYKHDRSRVDRVNNVIKYTLSKGGDLSLHMAAQLLSLHFKDLPESLIDIVLFELLRINPENMGTLKDIDHGLARLLNQGNWDKGVAFLENLLLANSNNLDLDSFENVTHELFNNNHNRLNRLMTRWFIKGDMILCEGIRIVTELAYDQNIQLKVDPSEFDSSDPMQVIFLARKSIGYLFSTPITAASIVISLVECATNRDAIQEVTNLLFDPLLINYPGGLKDYLINRSKNETEKVSKAIDAAVAGFDEYLNNLKTVGEIPELYPSQAQRETNRRHFSRLMTESMEKAKMDSVILSLVSTSVILHGSKSVDYVYSPDGQYNRMEIPLQSHSTEVEFPRYANIDSFSLDYMLRVFRAEQIIGS